jgi:tetratricopeptide (TPR) repeat protein
VTRAFNTSLLLTARAKELGLPSDALLQHARELAARLPPSPPGSVQPAVLIEAAAAVVGETSGFDPEERQQRLPRRTTMQEEPIPQRLALEPAVATDMIAEYLALAIDCDFLLRREKLNFSELLAKHAATPLMRFRVAVCGRRELVASLRAADARWADAFFFEGRAAMSASREHASDPEAALPLYASAHDAFPDSFAITLALAAAHDSLADYEPALAAYDAVLATAPTHRDALLGRVKSLSFLTRHVEAIAAATRMIELGTWLVGDAYYWRAWNQYHLKAYEPAWDDVQNAIKLQSNSSVYMLAGLIAYERTDLPTAIVRFDRSYELDNTNCDAPWMSALAHVDQKSWADASPKFTRAMTCFTAAAATASDDVSRVDSSNRTPAQKARQIATLTSRVKTAEERSAQSAFNAAQCYVLLGNKRLALTHVDVALVHPKMREKAQTLKAAIEKLP